MYFQKEINKSNFCNRVFDLSPYGFTQISSVGTRWISNLSHCGSIKSMHSGYSLNVEFNYASNEYPLCILFKRDMFFHVFSLSHCGSIKSM